MEWRPFGELIETTVTVDTWNLWWRFGDWEARLPATVETLRSIDADVVLLQEVWLDGARSQAAELGAALGYESRFESWQQVDGVDLGNAILSRWPIGATEVHTFSAPDDRGEHRAALRADIAGPRGPLQVFTTHLNWRFDEGASRCEQVIELLDFVRRSPKREFPAIVGGDFNADPASDEVRILTGRHRAEDTSTALFDAWEFVDPAEPGWTWDNDNPCVAPTLQPNRRIDYVFVGWPRAGGAGNVVEAHTVVPQSVAGPMASDHKAVIARLRY